MSKPRLLHIDHPDFKKVKAEYMREYRKENPDKFKRIDLKKNFGISLEYYYELLEKQGNVCAICKKPETAIDMKRGVPFSLAVDHDHKTGNVRGLLCMKCNRGLGLFEDSGELLDEAKRYLDSYREPNVVTR